MRYEAIEEEKWDAVMNEVTNQIRPFLEERKTEDEKDAFKLLLGTMLVVMDRIFGDLKAEEQDPILLSCGTWFDLGFLVGRSPQKLVEVMDKVSPGIVGVDLPDWLGPFAKSLTNYGK